EFRFPHSHLFDGNPAAPPNFCHENFMRPAIRAPPAGTNGHSPENRPAPRKFAKKGPSVGRAWRVSCLRGGALQDQIAALFIGQLAARLFAEGSGAEHLHG
ncbi:hypothetical protein JTM01_39855, partial [Pseudomonas aeruginosa]|nr:hypothetical protein [Pseudomonas aeruginosa]